MSAILFGLLAGAVALLNLLLFILTVVLFCIWIHRANSNARALGATALTNTPGWAVGWWFVPIAQLFKPYRAVREIYEQSKLKHGKPVTFVDRIPWLFPVWWGAWLIDGIGGNIAFKLWRSASASTSAASDLVGAAVTPFGAIAALAAASIVYGIQKRQVQRAARQHVDRRCSTTTDES